MATPCSVKAKGRYLECWSRFKVTFCDLKAWFSFSVNSNMKSSGKRLTFLLPACFNDFVLNCCKICNSCRSIQLAGIIDISQMPGNNGLVPLKQLGHLVEAEPKCLAFQMHFQRRLAVRRLVENDFAFALGAGSTGFLCHQANQME